jgi:hypothetical protein
MSRKTFDVTDAKVNWPGGIVRIARKKFQCDYHHGINGRCDHHVQPGEYYFDSYEPKPHYAGGFGSLRFCMACARGKEVQ